MLNWIVWNRTAYGLSGMSVRQWPGRPVFNFRSCHTKDFQKWYLISPCLTLSNIMYVSRVKWSNQKKGVVPSPTLRCRSYWKGGIRSLSTTAANFTFCKLSWCPSWSNSLWQEWGCRLVYCPGGNATDPIWRVQAST